VFRYNKRGASFNHANDNLALLLEADHRDLLEDARNALQALMTHPRTAATNLTVVGNSEGVLLALQLGVQHREIDLLVLIGSPAFGFLKSARYQNVDRSVEFAHRAGDENEDGHLTLEELDRIDGKNGRGSFHVLTIQDLLFEFEEQPDGSRQVLGFAAEVDVDGDGRVDIDGELKPALRAVMKRDFARWRSGALGRYFQSFLENKPPIRYVHRVHGKILFAQGELDIVTHISETLALIEKLDRHDRPWDAILFPKLGHTLSKSRDYYKQDGGLTVLDNPTQNAPKKKIRLQIIRRAKEMLDLGD
jgi:pimeloyl-ACP methyl ester carboxylesterase